MSIWRVLDRGKQILKKNQGKKNYKNLQKLIFRKLYTLPDGIKVDIGIVRALVPEAIFAPEVIGADFKGIQEYIVKLIEKVDIDMRHEIYSNIILSGGSSSFKGSVNRLNSEIRSLNGTIKNISAMAPGDTIRSAWQGGAIVASLDTFSGSMVTHEMYEEEGARVILKKFKI